jgi:hypothetical protein
MATNPHSLKGYLGAVASIVGVGATGTFDPTEFSAKAVPIAADKAVIQDTEDVDAPKVATLTNCQKILGEIAAGTNTGSALSETDGVLRVNINGTTAKTGPVSADAVLINDSQASNVNKACTVSNLTKALGISAVTAKTEPIAADAVLLNDSEATNVAKSVTLTNLTKAIGEVAAGTVTGSALSETDGVMRVNVGGATANAAPAVGDKVLVETGGANKSATITQFMKAGGEVFAGTNATSSLSEVDGVGRVNIGGTDAATGPAPADKLLIEVGGVNKATSITNFTKAVGEVMAGVAATSGVTEVDGVLTLAAKIAHLEAALLTRERDFTMSFEAGFPMTLRVYFAEKVTINKIRGIVTKAIAATDNGTVTCGNSSGASAGGVITATASDALAVEYTATPTTNNGVAKDSYYYLTSAKTTPGGQLLISLEYTVTA